MGVIVVLAVGSIHLAVGAFAPSPTSAEPVWADNGQASILKGQGYPEGVRAGENDGSYPISTARAIGTAALLPDDIADLATTARKGGPPGVEAIGKLRDLRRNAFKSRDQDSASRIESVLLSLMQEPDDYVADAAGTALSIDEPRAERAIPLLMEVLKKPGQTDARLANALRSLRCFGGKAAAVNPVLYSILKDPTRQDNVRAAAIMTLASTAASEKDTVPNLRGLLQRKDIPVDARCMAGLMLLQLKSTHAQESIRQLIGEIDDAVEGNAGRRYRLVVALSKLELEEESVVALARVAADLTLQR